jgi:hypothetical protein
MVRWCNAFMQILHTLCSRTAVDSIQRAPSCSESRRQEMISEVPTPNGKRLLTDNKKKKKKKTRIS